MRSFFVAFSEFSVQIVDFELARWRVTITDAVKLTEANRNTLKQHFRNLVARGHLQQQGSGRGVWYELWRLSVDFCIVLNFTTES